MEHLAKNEVFSGTAKIALKNQRVANLEHLEHLEHLKKRGEGLKTTEIRTETEMADLYPKIPRKLLRLDPYRKQVIFCHLHDKKQEQYLKTAKNLARS